MAKAKRSNGKRKYTKSKKKQEKLDLAVVGMIIISILLAVLIYTQSGYIGEHLSPLLGGIMGWMKYILPVGTFAIAIYLACDSKDTLSPKLAQYAAFLLCIATVMTIFQISKGTIDNTQSFSDVISVAYRQGESNIGGGAIGAIAAVPLVNLLGVLGATILCIGVALILLIFMFGIRPAEVIMLSLIHI